MVAIVTPDSAPAKRLVKNARASGRVIDATHGRKAKAVMVMENDSVVLSALTPETLMSRLTNVKAGISKDQEQEL